MLQPRMWTWPQETREASKSEPILLNLREPFIQRGTWESSDTSKNRGYISLLRVLHFKKITPKNMHPYSHHSFIGSLLIPGCWLAFAQLQDNDHIAESNGTGKQPCSPCAAGSWYVSELHMWTWMFMCIINLKYSEVSSELCTLA